MKRNLYSLISLLCVFCLFSSCGLLEPNEIPGIPWDTLNGTTWYIMESNERAVERWRFYSDSLVVDIEHFNMVNNIGVVHYREKHIGKVYFKDKEQVVTDNYYQPDTMLCTELQWKRMAPSMVDATIWTPVYDWSVYQWWWIESVNDSVALVGDAPYSYEIYKDNPVNLFYYDGWIYDRL